MSTLGQADTTASVASSAVSVNIFAAETSGIARLVFRYSTAVLYLKFGFTASETSYTVQIAAGGYYEFPRPALDDHFDRQWHSEMNTGPQRAKRRRNGQGNWRLVRYCDDFVVMVFGERRHAEALREEVSAVLAPMGLRLAPEKTQVVHVNEGFTFPGFDIRGMRKRGTSKYYVYTKPSKKAIASIKDKAKAKTYRSTLHMDLDELILSLNRSLAGWANYFRHGASKATFNAVDYFVWGRLMRWIRAKCAGKTGLSMKELRRRFCDQGWRFAHNGVVLTGASSVAVTRYRYRGGAIPTPWTPRPAAANPGS